MVCDAMDWNWKAGARHGCLGVATPLEGKRNPKNKLTNKQTTQFKNSFPMPSVMFADHLATMCIYIYNHVYIHIYICVSIIFVMSNVCVNVFLEL